MGSHDVEPLVAGRVPVHALMEQLARERPVFHSEADFQHSFARTLWETDRTIESRLEVRQPGTREYLDLLSFGPHRRTAIEFKYWTRRWSGPAGDPPEEFDLKAHAATDLARRNFVFDIERLERFSVGSEGNGIAVVLTNDPSLWSPPSHRRITRDDAFRIHEGRTLTGTLLWGGGDFPVNTRHLTGRYELRWKDYSLLSGQNAQFRYLVVETGRAAEVRRHPSASVRPAARAPCYQR